MQRNSLTLSVREAAAALGVSPNKVYDLVAENRIPHVRLGRLIKIPRHGLEVWLERQSGLPESPPTMVSSPQQH